MNNEEKDSSKYEMVNILSENEDSIFSPEHENITIDYYRPRIGQIYINVDIVGKIFADTLTNLLKGNLRNVK